MTLLAEFLGPGRGVDLLSIDGELYQPSPGSSTVVLKVAHQENFWAQNGRVIHHGWFDLKKYLCRSAEATEEK